MVQLLSLVSLVAFAGVGGFVGWRILKLARATGGAPERWVAVCLLAICAVAYPLLVVNQAVVPGGARVVLLLLGLGSAHVGIAAAFLFTRSAFRPDVRWLRYALAVVFAMMGAHWVGIATVLWGMRDSVETIVDAGPFWSLFASAVSGVGYAWTGAEALRYWLLLRRRVPLGLADPLVVNRMLLWGLVGISSTVLNVVTSFAIARAVNLMTDPVTMLTTAVLGSFNAAALWIAFVPPARYARWVRGGEPSVAAAS